MTTFTGKTVDDAIQKGLKSLEIKQSEAEINIIQVNRHGFFGIGRRYAKVEVAKKPESNPENNESSKTVHQSQENVKPEHTEKNNREESNQQNKSNHHQNEHSNYQKLDKKTVVNNLIDYLESIVEQLGINASVNIDAQNSKHIKLDFETDKEGLLIGRHGLTINALQELSQIYLNRYGIHHYYVELDTANYRERRMEVLEGLAQRTARKVVADGKPVYLDPMPSFERKKIHATLAHSDHVETYSAGREPHRAVVVAPAK
ncbi:RNA-binding protein [Philodulcilactobacillus myokoensis]|uniref:RNA-binding protein KhpB n=1 Tax=Philodulcilactobacillus myokoensis TaxID=2929573 RepID=A0A9W6AZZ6_9LACO|nr:RNA-binding cell elongation regulator Jag/EloR [Philodulcilactobacillus myokoensis]GLB46096.1 RNA-binding protein [Philodulcilactobacillus myokoensis]